MYLYVMLPYISYVVLPVISFTMIRPIVRVVVVADSQSETFKTRSNNFPSFTLNIGIFENSFNVEVRDVPEQGRHCTCNVTIRRVRVTIVAVEKQEVLNIICHARCIRPIILSSVVCLAL
jgi:hypothetical protein